MSRDLHKKSMNAGMIFVWMLSLAIVMGGFSHAESLTEIKGLKFNVPEDWPIEKRNGIIAPIPIGEYITIKFEAVEEKFQAIKDELLDKFDEVQSELENTEKDLSNEIENVRLESSSQEEASTDLTEVFTRFDTLDMEVSRLDKKIINKVTEMQVQFETTAQQIGFVEEAIKELQIEIYKLIDDIKYLEEKEEYAY